MYRATSQNGTYTRVNNTYNTYYNVTGLANGATYYYNPKTAVDKWIFSRTVQTVIGRHSFAI